ncbi:energy-coupling factor ABC transporter ATP-binding protein [Cohnella suwonensis]|uniref:Energy-coupling factor ABC transporter ATP-binding protein n=1 Tax=Cohnella suwonensis TaxID=696072 RepID=A0ABW0M4K4_9BACL
MASGDNEPFALRAVTVYGDVIGIAREHDGDVHARLLEVDVTISPGEWVAIVGANGSGKSTLARIVAGLYPDVMYGEAERGFAGHRASPIVLQQPRAQLFGETPREEIAFALEWSGAPAEQFDALVERALAGAGLSGLRDEPWESLSGGQQQLAAIAAATAGAERKPLVVLDEATSMLDDRNRDEVMRLATALHRQGTAVVWVTQRLDELLPDMRVIAMKDGRIVHDGNAREFLYGSRADVVAGADSDAPFTTISPCLRAGLRLPYMPSLALELRRLGRLDDPLPVTADEWRMARERMGDMKRDDATIR